MNRKAKALEFVDAEYNIQITGRHLQVTESMKDYAKEKISKIERFMHRIIDVGVIMDIQKLDHSVEIIMKAGNLKMTSRASTTDIYASIDKAVDKLEAQILRYKSKMQDHHAKGHADINMPVNIVRPQGIEDELDEFEDDFDNQFTPHQVIEKEILFVKTLSYDEAIIKIELSGEPFMVFKSEADKKLKIIYRRDDGNYGIIEPSL